MKVDLELYEKMREAWVMQQPEAQALFKPQLDQITAGMRDDPVGFLRAAVAVRERTRTLCEDTAEAAAARAIVTPLVARFDAACRAAGVEVDDGLTADELEKLARSVGDHRGDRCASDDGTRHVWLCGATVAAVRRAVGSGDPAEHAAALVRVSRDLNEQDVDVDAEVTP